MFFPGFSFLFLVECPGFGRFFGGLGTGFPFGMGGQVLGLGPSDTVALGLFPFGDLGILNGVQFHLRSSFSCALGSTSLDEEPGHGGPRV